MKVVERVRDSGSIAIPVDEWNKRNDKSKVIFGNGSRSRAKGREIKDKSRIRPNEFNGSNLGKRPLVRPKPKTKSVPPVRGRGEWRIDRRCEKRNKKKKRVLELSGRAEETRGGVCGGEVE